MKRLIGLSLVIVLVFLMVGCQIQPLEQTSAPQTAEDKEAAAIEKEISDIGNIDIDAELSELDQMEKDLESI